MTMDMADSKEIVCIICPIGCRMKVTYLTAEDGGRKVTGTENALCANGRNYAAVEVQFPKRNITSTIKVTGGTLPLVSVRSNECILREMIPETVRILKEIKLQAPVRYHQVIVRNILGTGADIISTSEVPAAGDTGEAGDTATS